MHVGIDLGTTYTSVAYFDSTLGKPVIIKNKYGNTVTPSVVCFNPAEGVQYGDDAKEMQEFGDQNTASFYKREIGNAAWQLKLNGNNYNAEDLSGIFLKNLIEELNSNLTDKITSAVITVPAYFDHPKRKATERAGQTAGLEVLDIINEPTAAAIAFGLDSSDRYGTYMVYDLGGGTFDVTIVKISASGIETIGTVGNHRLGGKDWDDVLLEYVTDLFNDEFGCDILNEIDSPYDLLVSVEKLKKNLTQKLSDSVTISFNGNKGKYMVTREQFNEMTAHLMDMTEMLCEDLLNECNMSWSQLNGVLLVGGSTRMVMVNDFVRRMSGKEPIHGINVDEAVALGAAIQSEIAYEEKYGKREFIGGKKSEIGIIGGKRIIDATAYALGRVQVSADRSRFINDVMIEKNAQIPCECTKPTLINARGCRNGETDIYVLQGSLERPLDNTILEKQVISGIDVQGKTDIILDVTYKYDRSGIVVVEAVQKDNGKRLNVRTELLPDDLSWLDENPDSIKVKGPAQDVEIILALDTSGSMYGVMDKVRDAAVQFVNKLDLSYVKVGVLEFESYVHTRLAPVDDYNQILSVLNSLNDGGGTEEPLTKAYSMLSGRDAVRYIVVMTDGDWCNADRAINVANLCRQEGIEIMTMGIGSGVNKAFLDKISTTDDYTIMTDTSSMVSAFSNIGQVIAQKTNGLRDF